MQWRDVVEHKNYQRSTERFLTEEFCCSRGRDLRIHDSLGASEVSAKKMGLHLARDAYFLRFPG